MNLDKILVGIFTVFGTSFTYWYFFMKKEDIVVAEKNSLDIIVEGGYNPSTVSIPKGKTTKINFLRKDKNPCLEEVVLSDFRIKEFLPLNKKVTIELTPEEKGEYNFSCGMNMYHGKLVVD